MQRGGSWLTYARPTNFHRFFRRKILLPGEVASDFIEVNTARKEEIEAEEAEFREPDSLLLEEAERIGATYDPATGFFVMNGLEDLSERDVRDILSMKGQLLKAHAWSPYEQCLFAKLKVRTLPELNPNRAGGSTNGMKAFGGSAVVESLVFTCGYDSMTVYRYAYTNVTDMFLRCEKLRLIKGLSVGALTKFNSTFQGCHLLEELELIDANQDVDLSWSKNLSAGSVEFIIDWRYEPGRYAYTNETRNAFTIALHPDAYARIPEDLFEKALESDITIVEKRN